MFEFISSSIGILAALISLLVGILTVIIIFRKKQLHVPELIFSLGALPEEEARKSRRDFKKSELLSLIYCFQDDHYGDVVIMVPYTFENKGRDPVKNVRLQLEYDSSNLIDNRTIKYLYDNSLPTLQKVDEHKKIALVAVPTKLDQDIDKVLECRKTQVIGSKAIVSYEIPLIRPGEKLILPDSIILRNNALLSTADLGFGEKGFEHILKNISSIEQIRDFFISNAWVYAENYPSINKKFKIFSVKTSKLSLVEKILEQISKALWFGRFPRMGIYFVPYFPSWFLKKRTTGRRFGEKLYKYEFVMIVIPTFAKINTKNGSKYLFENIADSAVEFAVIYSPNCNYYDLPEWVSNYENLIRWLGTSSKPVIKYT